MKSVFELNIIEESDGTLNATMMVDGKPFGDDCVDLLDLRKSAIISGAYDLQTCGCGTPQCAGFWEPIFVQHVGDVIRWEFDNRFHPTVIKDKSVEMSVVRYEFDRVQYIKEIQTKFAWLNEHPERDSVGPYGFDPTILGEKFPDPLVTQLPFAYGASIVFGYTSEFHQPWVWVEGSPEVYPRQLLPTGAMWSQFGCWSLMWDSEYFDLGQCIYRKDTAGYLLRNDVTSFECNQAVESLAQEVQQYWGTSAKVFWDMVEDSGNGLVKRLAIPACTSI